MVAAIYMSVISNLVAMNNFLVSKTILPYRIKIHPLGHSTNSDTIELFSSSYMSQPSNFYIRNAHDVWCGDNSLSSISQEVPRERSARCSISNSAHEEI